jgi:hypothetical protein
VEALNSYEAPEEEDGSMHLSIQAPEIYARFAVVTHRVYGGSDDEEDEDGSEDDDDDHHHHHHICMLGGSSAAAV